MKKKVAMLLMVSMTICGVLTGCGGSQETAAETSGSSAEAAAGSDLVYAVETGSAGEAVAQEKGFQTNAVASQADALMEVASGTSDAAIIDLLMAGAMIGEGTSYPNLVHTDELTTEEYGVGCRKGSDLASFINSVFAGGTCGAEGSGVYRFRFRQRCGLYSGKGHADCGYYRV